LQRGAAVLSDAELLAVLLRTGYKGCSVLQLARNLLTQFGSISGIFRADGETLQGCHGVGVAKYTLLQAALELARRQALELASQADALTSPDLTRQFLQYHLGGHQREVFSCIFLDSQNRVICCEDLFWGTLDGAAVYPREVALKALQHSCSGVIFAHNHPSGVAEPSMADKHITQRLQAALALLDIKVLDHIIIGKGQQYSFAEAGLL
jgi:DNA repair protein RadC